MHGRIHYRTSLIQAGAAVRAAAVALQRRGVRMAEAIVSCAEREERSYRHYLQESLAAYRAFSQLSPLEQRAYWSWRLTHGDQL